MAVLPEKVLPVVAKSCKFKVPSYKFEVKSDFGLTYIKNFTINL